MTEEAAQDAPVICQMIADIIRDASRNGQPVSRETVHAELAERGMRADADLDALLETTLAFCADLASFQGVSDDKLYHAPALLSRTYAAILDRRKSPVILIAEEVRRLSADYPRPLLLDIFEMPPFDLTPEQIEVSLRTMAASSDYADISYTTASTGAVYLFSSRHMERRYAAFLAEREETELSA